MQIWLDLNWDV